MATTSSISSRDFVLSVSVLFLLFGLLAPGTHSFSAGVPALKSVCQRMLPQHDTNTPQASIPPFEITTYENKEVEAEGDITVTLRSTGDVPFKGFYLQARNNLSFPVGSFEVSEDSKAHSCYGLRRNGAYHGNGKVDKTSVAISWTAPANYIGEITFRGTFVKDYVTIWSNVESEPIQVIPKVKGERSLASLTFG